MEPQLKITGLKADRGAFRLGPIDLELQPGQVLSLIGPNGVGKTSLLLSMLGILKANSGTVELMGRPAASSGTWRAQLGVVLDGCSYYEGLSVGDNLNFHSGFYPTWDQDFCKHLLKNLALNSSKMVGHLSRGERQKLGLILALSHRPQLLILDEATAGLDPLVRAEVMDLLLSFLQQGETSILMSTHLLSDVEKIADHLAFMHDGKIILNTTKDDLLNSWRRVSFRYDGDGADIAGVLQHRREGRRHLVTTCAAQETIDALAWVGADDVDINRLGLDEITVEILKRGAK